MSKAFSVKHNASTRGALVTKLPSYCVTPWSFSSKEHETREAAEDGAIYVIEVRRSKAIGTTYWLGYRFHSVARKKRPGGGKWDERFTYMNVSTPPVPAIGHYFPSPVRIDDPTFHAWYVGVYGMAELSAEHRSLLDQMFTDPLLYAKPCA